MGPTPVRPQANAERSRELAAYYGYRVAERLAGILPRGAGLLSAAAVGNLVHDLANTKRDVIRANLARPMGLPPDDPRVGRQARRAFRNYGRYLIDMLRLGRMTDEEADRLVHIENPEALAQGRAGGGVGLLVCTVHVGGMDLIGPGLRRHGERIHVVADDTTYGRLYRHLAAVRARHAMHLIGWRNLRGLFRALRGGENLVLFCDGGYRPSDVPVTLFGEVTTFPIGPATLAAKTGAAMMPVYVRRTPDDRFVARGLPLIHATSTEPGELQRATQQLADALGPVIAEDPGQWYMFRPVWPTTDEDRARAESAHDMALRGEDWTRRRLP